jgi:hypothetical protein
MNSSLPAAEVPSRNPIARSLALAVLGVALVAAAIMGAVVFAVLLGVFAVGYLVSRAHTWWRMVRVRRRMQSLRQRQSPAAQVDAIDGEYEVVEAAADAAPRGPGGPA